MKQIVIRPIEELTIPGVTVQLPGGADVYEDGYLRWKGSRLPIETNCLKIAGGVLEVWHSAPVFSKLEYHEDREKFIFISGDVVMPFADVRNGEIVEDSLCCAHIQAGTELVIDAGKAHFMPVAASADHAVMAVVCPEMPFFHVFLKEPVLGVF